MKKFPKNFYWGTATSAYQVEGGIKNNWSEAGKALHQNKFDAGQACDHYNRFEQDFDLAKKMNNNAHRFSIEWARIEPEQGKFNQKEIEHYKKVVKALKQRGLEPFVTLYHWTLPVWLTKQGGWLNKKASECFVKYVEFVVENLLEVKFWITINEPNIYVSNSFIRGIHPPFKKINLFKARKAFYNLIEAHKRSYQMIRQLSPKAQIGFTKFNVYYNKLLKLFIDYHWNHRFLKNTKEYFDFIGLNYYLSQSLFELLRVSGKNRTDIGWPIYPKGIYYVLKDLKRYNKPIYITENGLADAKDSKRADFIINHLKYIHKAIEQGVNVKGYFHWSLMDNFEWDKGFKPKFGLIEIDYKTLKRTPRPSSKVYAEICKNNAINI